MDTATTRHDLTPDTYAIDATVTKDGHSFTAGGGFVSPELVIAYCKKVSDLSESGDLTLWDGTVIGIYWVVSKWHVDSAWSTHRYAIGARIGKQSYHGRTYGDGMCVTLRPYKAQS